MYFEKSVLDHTSAPIAPAPKYRRTAETVEIKKEMEIERNKPDGAKISTKMDGSAKKVTDATTAVRAAKRRNEKKELCRNS